MLDLADTKETAIEGRKKKSELLPSFPVPVFPRLIDGTCLNTLVGIFLLNVQKRRGRNYPRNPKRSLAESTAVLCVAATDAA